MDAQNSDITRLSAVVTEHQTEIARLTARNKALARKMDKYQAQPHGTRHLPCEPSAGASEPEA